MCGLFFFFFGHTIHHVELSHPGMELKPPELEPQSPNHWTPGKSQESGFLNLHTVCICQSHMSPVNWSQLPEGQLPPHQQMRLSSWTQEAGNPTCMLVDPQGSGPTEGPLAGGQQACPDHTPPCFQASTAPSFQGCAKLQGDHR